MPFDIRQIPYMQRKNLYIGYTDLFPAYRFFVCCSAELQFLQQRNRLKKQPCPQCNVYKRFFTIETKTNVCGAPIHTCLEGKAVHAGCNPTEQNRFGALCAARRYSFICYYRKINLTNSGFRAPMLRRYADKKYKIASILRIIRGFLWKLALASCLIPVWIFSANLFGSMHMFFICYSVFPKWYTFDAHNEHNLRYCKSHAGIGLRKTECRVCHYPWAKKSINKSSVWS